MSLSVTVKEQFTEGKARVVRGTLAFDTSYPTGGEPLAASAIGLSGIEQIDIAYADAGYVFDYDKSNEKLKVFEGGAAAHTHAITAQATDSVSGGTPAGTNSTSSVTGTADAQAFTGTAPLTNLDLATPAFSGTGLTAVGQDITTTDNQTMTLNECAGMWLISATQSTPPNLILSNTAVAGAPAVLTVQGSANTDAGAYTIVKHAAPVGVNAASSLSASTAAAQAFTGSALAGHTHSTTGVTDSGAGAAAALSEVANATDLSTALDEVEFEARGI